MSDKFKEALDDFNWLVSLIEVHPEKAKAQMEHICEAQYKVRTALQDAQRVENRKTASDVMAKNFNHLIATCDTWTREAVSENVMTTILPNQLKVCKEALRDYERAEK